MSGGIGNDEITISARGEESVVFRSSPGQTAYGVVDSSILGGRGDDSITIRSTYQNYPSNSASVKNSNSIGLVNSTLAGGAGNDILTVSGLNLDLQDVIVSGGNGEDIFDIGIGSAKIAGGQGYDILKLDFFDAATMSITQLGTNSIQIVGTQDKQGNGNDWTQTISGVESYDVAGTLYSATDVVNLLG